MALTYFINIAFQSSVSLLLVCVFTIFCGLLYRLSPLHPLACIPGPYQARLSSLWLTYHSWWGDEASTVHSIHQRYGRIARIGPNSVDIADGEALHAIYVAKGGFRKPRYYLNFVVGEHRTLFSTIDPSERAPRAKAVLPAFSPESLRSRRQVVNRCVKDWIDVLTLESKSGKPVDILGLARSFAADSVAESLFGVKYGALEKSRAVATSPTIGTGSGTAVDRADGMLDAFDIVGRYWYLPPWAFTIAEWLRLKLFSDKAVFDSFTALDTFATKAVKAAVSEKQDLGKTFQGRLLEAGFSESETQAQVQDGMFAGIDTTGLNLAIITWNLAKRPDKYNALRQEILEANVNDDEIQSLPLLRGAIQEGLRISTANPTRMPRVVPGGGWHFQENVFPAGVEVSCSSFELHNDGDVFESPHEFRPERWLTASKEMYRDLIPFGTGTRRCIAMNLALLELYCAVYQLVKNDVLAGTECCQQKIEIVEWFNIKVVGGRIDLRWKS